MVGSFLINPFCHVLDELAPSRKRRFKSSSVVASLSCPPSWQPFSACPFSAFPPVYPSKATYTVDIEPGDLKHV
jgi:hypothetical protein